MTAMNESTLRTLAFPTLTDAEIAELGRCAAAESRTYPDGQTLVHLGQRDFPFFVVKSGELVVMDYSGDQPNVITVHRKGNFSGDVSHLTGAPAVVQLSTRGETEVYEITREALRHVLNQCPSLSDTLLQAFIARRQLLRESPDFVGLRVIGSRYSQDTFRVRDFLARNRWPFTWIDLESDPHVDQLLKEFGLAAADTPVVACAHRLMMRNPTNRELADALGIRQPLDSAPYDLVVVGAGPAGLAAAVYAASEGLRTLVLDSYAPGGQAGSSMRIENYLGFPLGISGGDLIDKARTQALKFGAQLSSPVPVTGLEFDNGYPILHLDGNDSAVSKCLLITTGAEYRKLDVEGFERFEGTGVYYAATPAEGLLCMGAQIVVVGGGNSAGQAAVYLAGHARKVLLMIRGDDLNKNMSSYLVERIEQTPNIELLKNTTIRRMLGDGHLSCVECFDSLSGETRFVETPAVFSFIGAVPRTEWLPPQIERDDKGFVRTGPKLAQSPHWSKTRAPYFVETTRPGVFAAGDVRAGSVKRVAAAVGEGSMAVQFVHEYLREL